MPSPGSIDYRFARRQLLRRFRAGELARNDVCDAQSELLRIGTNCSRRRRCRARCARDRPCGWCGSCSARGCRPVAAVVEDRAELAKLAERYGGRPPARTYTVEVCLECRWNHLIEVVPLPRSRDALQRALDAAGHRLEAGSPGPCGSALR